MTVELKNVTTVSLGDTVTVTLSDGSTEKEGTVASMDETTCTVTLTDKGTTLGELVSVKDEAVEAGDTLAALKDVPASARYQELAARREKLTERLKSLIELSEQTAEITIQFPATDIKSCGLTIAAPEVGAAPQTSLDGTAAYSGTISWGPQAAVFAANSQYIATVKLTANEGYRFAGSDQIAVTLNGSRVSQVSVSEDASQVTMILAYQIGENGKSKEPGSEAQTDGTQQTGGSQQKESQQTNGAQQQGNNQPQNESQQSEGQGTGKTVISPSSGTATGGTGNGSVGISAAAGSGTGSSSSGSTSESAQNAAEDVDTSKVTAFTISPEEDMKLSVSVDELDILSIALDQKAEISFDAIEDETFEGTITSISDTASVNGGVAKYTVKITLPKNDSMKVGMNASATITIEDKQDILLIPVSALQERGSSVFVYTEQAEESGALSGEVEVETGLSDGSSVEITGGLSEGDVVYCTRTASEAGESGFNMVFGIYPANKAAGKHPIGALRFAG